MYWVYILSNLTRSTIYTGVTNDLVRRLHEHREGLLAGFSKKYRTHSLVYLEETSDIVAAITREKQLKGWTRAKKNALIESMNPHWEDLGVKMGIVQSL